MIKIYLKQPWQHPFNNFKDKLKHCIHLLYLKWSPYIMHKIFPWASQDEHSAGSLTVSPVWCLSWHAIRHLHPLRVSPWFRWAPSSNSSPCTHFAKHTYLFTSFQNAMHVISNSASHFIAKKFYKLKCRNSSNFLGPTWGNVVMIYCSVRLQLRNTCIAFPVLYQLKVYRYDTVK